MLVGKVIQILTKIRFCFCRQNDSASFGHSYSFGHFCFMAKAIFCVGLKILRCLAENSLAVSKVNFCSTITTQKAVLTWFKTFLVKHLNTIRIVNGWTENLMICHVRQQYNNLLSCILLTWNFVFGRKRQSLMLSFFLNAAQMDTLKSELNVIRDELKELELAGRQEAFYTLTPEQVRVKILLLLSLSSWSSYCDQAARSKRRRWHTTFLAAV